MSNEDLQIEVQIEELKHIENHELFVEHTICLNSGRDKLKNLDRSDLEDMFVFQIAFMQKKGVLEECKNQYHKKEEAQQKILEYLEQQKELNDEKIN